MGFMGVTNMGDAHKGRAVVCPYASANRCLGSFRVERSPVLENRGLEWLSVIMQI